jgi:hypothetical protein
LDWDWAWATYIDWKGKYLCEDILLFYFNNSLQPLAPKTLNSVSAYEYGYLIPLKSEYAGYADKSER